jgi:hypothetical protein
MLPTPAQYLLRFDDLCPTLDPVHWQRFLALIEEFHLRPILAIVPDNQDRKLRVAPENPFFWEQMRKFEAAGATIALHGYRHLCTSHGKSLLALHRRSEFAGVPEELQANWIRAGLDILRGHGLHPRLWVAPRHGFDRTTLRVLHQLGIRLLSDGLTRKPFNLGGITWIPQQLWEPVEKSNGLWTICIHSNTASLGAVERLRSFLCTHIAQFTSVDRVLAELHPGNLVWSEALYATSSLWRIKMAKSFRRQLRKKKKIA